MLFETLESRQLLTYFPGEIPTLDAAYVGPYLPTQTSQASTAGTFLTAPSAAPKASIGVNYLTQNAPLYGVSAVDFQKSIITNSYESNGITHVYLQQTFYGLPIADANASVHIAANGQIISAHANYVRNVVHPGSPTTPPLFLSASGAVGYYADAMNTEILQPLTVQMGAPGVQQETIITAPDLSNRPINAKLQFVPRPDGSLTLGWKLNVITPDGKHWWDLTIGASPNAELGKIIQLTDWVANASYQVFERPTQDPLFGPRTIAVDPHDANGGSPFGWHDANGIAGPEFLDTRGNNVSAQDDLDGNNSGHPSSQRHAQLYRPARAALRPGNLPGCLDHQCLLLGKPGARCHVRPRIR
jgi:hypothetical protein